MNRNIEEYGHGPECDFSLFGELLDGRVEDCPVDDDDDDMENKASGVEELQEPEIPWGGSISLSSEVPGCEAGQSVGVPGVQDKVAAEEEGANVGKKEKELDSSFVRSEMESEGQCHGQIQRAEETKDEETEGREAPRSVPGVQVVSVHPD